LVTDDGEFLVLVSAGLWANNALLIYRRQRLPGESFGSNGVLIREIPLSLLWPAESLNTPLQMKDQNGLPEKPSRSPRTIAHSPKRAVGGKPDLLI
jgi:hypothetical protein